MDGMIGEYHTSLYPKYFPKKLRSRTLARWENYNIITEYGEYIKIDSYDQLKFTLVSQSIDCYFSGVYDDYTGFPYLDMCLHDDNANVLCSHTGGIVAVAFTYLSFARRTGNVCFATTWGHRNPSQIFLNSLRRLFDTYRVGDHPTPGSLGDRGLVLKMKEQSMRVHRPNNMMRNMLLKYNIGGRADFDILYQNKVFEELFEEDRNSGYPAECEEVMDPGETVVRILGDVHNYENPFTYFVECEVSKDIIPFNDVIQRSVIPEFGMGPLPIREEGRIWYPEYGYWKSAYWKEEIELAREQGWTVKTGNGYLFRHGSPFMKEWAHDLYKLIHDFKDSTNEVTQIEDHIAGGMSKLVPLALVGRFGRKPEKIEVVPENLKQEGDRPVLDYFSAMPIADEWYIHVSPDKDMNALTQIYHYVLMKMRVALFKRMQQHIAYGNEVVGTNYDAIYLTKPSQLLLGTGLGEWKQKCLHNVNIPHSRHLHSDEKVTTPGISKIG